ncbi:hypothetical protein BC939DRAFT_508358 [Gamsiella multidivaricata]|uniref:uncharacterized protein n=1 Tax=Gamsiella multidivaricata TaxID=101098 RepID=UPI00221F19CE|nr:uncharacterized protein BC939DRAFT_508358 [Gamsiella multidivaricata]KAI7816370.1 hypothetical protein BC939DRAFT_508358 [Gamsiella multidivaricata]
MDSNRRKFLAAALAYKSSKLILDHAVQSDLKARQHYHDIIFSSSAIIQQRLQQSQTQCSLMFNFLGVTPTRAAAIAHVNPSTNRPTDGFHKTIYQDLLCISRMEKYYRSQEAICSPIEGRTKHDDVAKNIGEQSKDTAPGWLLRSIKSRPKKHVVLQSNQGYPRSTDQLTWPDVLELKQTIPATELTFESLSTLTPTSSTRTSFWPLRTDSEFDSDSDSVRSLLLSPKSQPCDRTASSSSDVDPKRRMSGASSSMIHISSMEDVESQLWTLPTNADMEDKGAPATATRALAAVEALKVVNCMREKLEHAEQEMRLRRLALSDALLTRVACLDARSGNREYGEYVVPANNADNAGVGCGRDGLYALW